MTPLHRLAKAAGVARCWTDADGVARTVSDNSLRAVLGALGLPANSESDTSASLREIARRRAAPPRMITADVNQPIDISEFYLNGRLVDEDGAILATDLATLRHSGVPQPGYYRLENGAQTVHIAVSPTACRALPRRCWGVAIQIPSLRGKGAFGDFSALAEAVSLLGRRGVDAVMLSPVHALDLDDAGRFAPYSPSSRIALNALFGAADTAPTDGDLIDWTAAGPAKLASLRTRFDASGDSDFARFLQHHARAGLDAVQQAARDAGMAIGLITDLAVGVDPAGADAQGQPDAFLHGLRIGAPPDPLGPQGQDWGLTSYSPQGLRDSGFAPFIAMLRANLPRGGGIRIDHAFGLQRLWVVPEGRPASEGAYLDYPFADLLRLIKLEAWRADAVVIAEDLGTRPPGFSDALAGAGVHGMAVLPFARDEDGVFLPAEDYPATAIAMTATHDTATVAGWWTARDLEWNRKLDRGGDSPARRAQDRAALWQAIGDGAPQPADDDPAPVIDAAIAFLAATPAPLMIVPMEDMAGLVEQPNLPGTVDEHPNWRRRLPAPVAALLARPDIARRIDRLNEERGG
jgi:4-alpha-glucanotransferase